MIYRDGVVDIVDIVDSSRHCRRVFDTSNPPPHPKKAGDVAAPKAPLAYHQNLPYTDCPHPATSCRLLYSASWHSA